MEVVHNKEKQKFTITLQNKEAYLSYQKPQENIMDFQHTVVPKEFSGQGIAGKLVKAGLEEAQKTNSKVIPTCSYVKGFFDKNPQYQNLRQD